MKKIIVFAGTKEGRELSLSLVCAYDEVHVNVATEYGEEIIDYREGMVIHQGRLDEKGIIDYIEDVEPQAVVDATHPYARAASANIRKACEKTGYTYLRLLRDNAGDKSGCVCFDTKEEAVDYLNERVGNILLTTGSKELGDYVRLINDKSRIIARFLADSVSVAAARDMGLSAKQIICMQGPFSTEMNAATLRQYEAKFLVTKETGSVGGFPEKIEGARLAGAEVVVINRPKEEGMTYSEICKHLGI